MGNGQAMVVVVMTEMIPVVIVVMARPKTARIEARPAVYSCDTGRGVTGEKSKFIDSGLGVWVCVCVCGWGKE